MTLDEMTLLALPIDVTAHNLLMVNSGINWLTDNTTLDVTEDDFDKIKLLPSCAKLFLCKFCEISSRTDGVLSETMGPMSQSFGASSSSSLIRTTARQLLKMYLKPTSTFTPCKRGWNP